MVQVFEFEGGWDVPEERTSRDFEGFDDRDVFDDPRSNQNISGPTSDGYVEIGGKVYEASNHLTPAQEKAWADHVNETIERGRSFVINGKTYYYSR